MLVPKKFIHELQQAAELAGKEFDPATRTEQEINQLYFAWVDSETVSLVEFAEKYKEENMTVDEKVEAYRMLLNGSTYQEISDKFGVTRQRIQQLIPGVSTKRKAAINSCVYKGISRWMQEKRYGYNDLAKMASISYQNLYMMMTGKTSLSKRSIDKILDATSLTYEEAFQKK